MEMTFIISAIGLGFASGFHCIGMCGPIALSMGLTKNQKANFYLQNLTYQLGRILTYSILGAVLGIIGQSFELAGFQKYLTVSVGILLIIMAISSFGGKDFATKIPFVSKALLKVKMKLGKILQRPDYKSRFATGILNGFLPCGMVYMALTASLAAGGIWQGSLFMLLFGLGTFPFMFTVVFLGNFITTTFRVKILRLIPVMMIFLGGLFILRGLELGIPYVSPKPESLQVQHSTDGFHMDHTNCH
ncbi:MAG: sulfite exporter TauE/SafE family protein [Chryseobacterium sp.]|jgi:sulfite exporter TauE/SafE|nr:sulfite exporter TauE/SafE family protein [Epilithonimonas pallida]MBN9336993.1 sulfite exporter TauE/SafE family protein [Chryseobacterium sp.]OJX28930.1 MAG: cytochrome C biogenesis protein [Chryseobacterium sp. 36-9]